MRKDCLLFMGSNSLLGLGLGLGLGLSVCAWLHNADCGQACMDLLSRGCHCNISLAPDI